VVRGATPEATGTRWWDTNNVRWRGGVMQPIGGSSQLVGSAVDALPRDVLTWHDNTFARWAAYGTDTNLYAYSFDDQKYYDITPTGAPPILPPGYASGYGLGFYGNGVYGISAPTGGGIQPPGILGKPTDWWSMDTFGDLLVVVPTQDGHLYSWDPTTPGVPATQVLNAPTQNRGCIVTDQRQVVLLGADGDPRRIAWSDQEDMTVWTPGVANLAGDKQLVTTAAVLTATKTQLGILIFTTNDAHLMQYVGPPYAYGITQVGFGCGPISPRAVVNFGSLVVWPSNQNWWQYSGAVQALQCDVKDWFFATLNPSITGRLFGSPNPQFAEAWWDFPDANSTGECNRYLFFNYGSSPPIWGIGSRARAGGDRAGTMDYPIMGGAVGSGGALFQHEVGYTDDGVSRAAAEQVYAETGNMALGEGDQRMDILQVTFDGNTSVTQPAFGFRFFAREQPFDAANEWDTGVYTEINNGLMDTRVSGRSVRVRVQGTADAGWEIGKPHLLIQPAGSR
jgi:hypothetical protein